MKTPVKNEGRLPLAGRIRISYLLLLIPVIIFLLIVFFYFWQTNETYENMLNSVVEASQFSLDFKNDFDYETYLLIVGNKPPEESGLDGMLSDAEQVVDGLEQYTNNDENRGRLVSISRYLDNLGTYIERIRSNMEVGDRYEDNMLIWENDVQIVTTLIRDSIMEYIYYENRQLQISQEENRAFFLSLLRVSAVFFILLILVIFIYSYFVPLSITRPIEEQVRREQTRLRKAEFELLQAQINPHFLYNTLDAIVWSAESGNNRQVVSMVGNLSDFFRASLNRGRDVITVREDLNHVRSYLEIQKVRYNDILEFQIDVPEAVTESPIPKITLQPLVENALYHGIKNRRGGGRILITGEENESGVIIKVIDNGAGMSETRLNEVRRGLTGAPDESAIYGLYNVGERIRLNFGEEYGLNIESTEGEGTCVTVHLPKRINIQTES